MQCGAQFRLQPSTCSSEVDCNVYCIDFIVFVNPWDRHTLMSQWSNAFMFLCFSDLGVADVGVCSPCCIPMRSEQKNDPYLKGCGPVFDRALIVRFHHIDLVQLTTQELEALRMDSAPRHGRMLRTTSCKRSKWCQGQRLSMRHL